MKKILLLACVALLTLAFLAGCGEKTGETHKPVIAVSIMPEVEWAQSVVGDDFEVVAMIPQGASPETYEPTQKDMQAFADAKIFFSIGVPAERKLIQAAQEANVPVVKLDEVIRARYGDLTMAPHHDHDGDGDHENIDHASDGNLIRDPHIWLSIDRAEVAVLTMVDELGQLYPEQAETYEKNGQRYLRQLTETSAQIQGIFANKTKKDFIIAHPSFGYFADQFGLRQFGLEADGKEATADHLSHLIDFAKKNNITAVFYDESHAATQAETFADEIDGVAVKVNPLAANYCENMIAVAKSMASHMV